MQRPLQFFPLSKETFIGIPGKRIDALLNTSIVTMVMTIALFLALVTIAEPDLWGHVRFGQDILRSGHIPLIDQYSYVTAGAKNINHEWLAESIMAACYNLGAVYGLICLKAIIVFVIYLLTVITIFRCGFGAVSGSLFFLFIASSMNLGTNVMRPQLFTYLLFFITCLLLAGASTNVKKITWLLPLAFTLWANLHGGYLLALSILAVWLLAEIIQAIKDVGRRQYLPHKLLLVILCFMAVSINPYGIELPIYTICSVAVPRPEIGEWHPISITSYLGIIYLLTTAITIFSLCVSTKKPSLSSIAIILVMIVSPLMAYRHLPLFAIAITVFAAEHIRGLYNYFSRKSPPLPFIQLSKPSKLILLLTSLSITIVLVCMSCKNSGHIIILKNAKLPIAAVSLMKELKLKGNLATFFDWGEYIIWHLSPGTLVSIDGRRDSAYPPNAYALNILFTYGTGPWDALLEKYHTDMVLVSKEYAVYNLMKLKPGWRLVYEDENSALFLPIRSEFLAASIAYLSKNKPPELSKAVFP